jgi:glycosyltransferase involved in cell wall biosynthesis
MMLRTLDEKFGIGTFTQYLTDNVIKLDRENQYVLFYRNDEHIGKYKEYPNVEEKLISAPNKLIWDQIAVLKAAKQENIDLLFHTKFTLPFMTKCKTVMVLHGASWFVHPELYDNKLDLMYIRKVLPLYCRKADALIANSKLTENDFVNILKVPREKIKTIYFGLEPIFKPIEDRSVLEKVKKKYNLPDRFILTVSRYDPRKNFATTFKAFTNCKDAGDIKLVAVGKESWKYKEDCGIAESGFEDDVIFPGYIDHDELPAFYNLAEVYIFPSVYEELGIPLIESMACGCPIVASNSGAIPEITDNIACLSDPFDADGMAAGIDKLTHDPDFRNKSIEKGFLRAQEFSYENSARKTVELFEKVMEQN